MKKNLSRALSLLLALAMSLALVACGGGDDKPTDDKPADSGENVQTDDKAPAEEPSEEKLAADQYFSFIIRNEPANLDPWFNNNGEASIVINAVHEPMLRRTDDGGWTEGLCTSYEKSEDGKTHTLVLRDDAKWQDGTPVTMDDVLYSIQRALDPEMASGIAYRYFPIVNAEAYYTGKVGFEEVGVKAEGNTITYTTTEPCDFFIDLLTSDSMAPVQKACAEANGELYGTDVDKLVASGPYKLTEWTHQNSMILEKNENYWDAENVKMDKIEIVITADANTGLGMYQSDALSIIRVGNDQRQLFDENEMQVDTRLKVTFIEFNPGNDFLANKNIREALSIAFNRQIFAEQILKNGKLAAYGLVPYGVIGLNGGDFREQAGSIVADASDEAEIQRAKDLLATGLEELGKTPEELQEGFTIQCLESGKQQAQAIQNMWKVNLGIEMPVQILDMGVLLPMLMEGTFDCVIGGGQDSNYRDPQGFMQFIYDENKWDNAEFRTLVEKAHTQTGDERIQTWMDIEKLVLDNFIYIPQVYAENTWAIKPNVRGLHIFTYGTEFDFKDVYIVE